MVQFFIYLLGGESKSTECHCKINTKIKLKQHIVHSTREHKLVAQALGLK